MDRSELNDEILKLTLLVQREEATDVEIARLDLLLATRREARVSYLNTSDDTATLIDDSKSKESSPERVELRQDASWSDVGGVGGSIRQVSSRFATPMATYAVGACLLLGLGWSATTLLRTGETPTPPGSLAFNGQITDLANVSWTPGSDDYDVWSRVTIDDRLRFDSGKVELALDNGARVLLEGPADFQLRSSKKAIMRQGRLVMRCGPEAVGFVIESPYANVVDQGTVFGMSVANEAGADVIVYEGSVDLFVPKSAGKPPRRLGAGEALKIGLDGAVDRIATVESKRFLAPRDLTSRGDGHPRLIASISDNLRSADTAKYYRIIGEGFREDCRAYVDRLHEWNGLDRQGLPRFLVGGDYVMTFNDDKLRNLRIAVELTAPAHVYVLWDDRVAAPEWLASRFFDTGWDVGLDSHIVAENLPSSTSEQRRSLVGAGKSIDRHFSVWRRDAKSARTVQLGALQPEDLGDVDPYSVLQSMYGIVVTPFSSEALIEDVADTGLKRGDG